MGAKELEAETVSRGGYSAKGEAIARQIRYAKDAANKPDGELADYRWKDSDIEKYIKEHKLVAQQSAVQVHRDARGLRLFKHTGKDDLIGSESVYFKSGSAGVSTVLRRASISGRVEVGGAIQDYFADVLNENGDLLESVCLDRESYRALKTRWMRCKIVR